MDYTSQSLGFKLKKAARYVRLYGPSRTLVKIRGQYHMRRSYDELPSISDPPPAGGHVADRSSPAIGGASSVLFDESCSPRMVFFSWLTRRPPVKRQTRSSA